MKTSHNGARARTHDPLDLVRDDITAIKRDLTALVNNRIDAFADRTKGGIAQAGEGVKSLSAYSKEQAARAHRRLSETAGEHPLKTMGAAAVGGAIGVLLLGRMWRRSGE